MSPLLIAIAAGGAIVAIAMRGRKGRPADRKTTANDSGGWAGDTDSSSGNDCSSGSNSDSGGDCGGGDGGGGD